MTRGAIYRRDHLPSNSELRMRAIELQVDAFREQFDLLLSQTRRGRAVRWTLKHRSVRRFLALVAS